MKSIDLISCRDNIYSYSQVHYLNPEELFYVRVKSLRSLPYSQFHLIKIAAAKSSQVVLSIPHQELSDTGLIQSFLNLGVKGFSARVSPHETERPRHPHLLTFEFQILSHDITNLAQDIVNHYKNGLQWIVLNVPGQPDEKRTKIFHDFFEILRMKNCTRLNVYFPFWNNFAAEWNIRTQNTFSGIEVVHIDLSNRCTHSCVFCGLYGPDATEYLKERSGGYIPETISNHLKQEMDSAKCFSIIENLPWTVKMIQFGGVGDPLMHENATDFILKARKKGIHVEVLSNLEYLNDEQIQKIHALGGPLYYDMQFIVNISAGTAETYVKTRPRQTEQNFRKVVHNMSLFSELRKKNSNSGVNMTMMCVVTKLNCHELYEYALLAHQVGARSIWFKPLEIHMPFHKNYIPSPEHMLSYVASMKKALRFSDENGIEVVQRNSCEEIIRQYS